MDHEALAKQLREWVLNRAWDQICCFLEERGQLLFSDQHIAKYYHIIKNVDLDGSSHLLPKLMMGWLAFLSGDQPAVVRLVRQLDQTPMDHLVHEYSFFLSFKALAAPLVGESDPLMIAETAMC